MTGFRIRSAQSSKVNGGRKHATPRVHCRTARLDAAAMGSIRGLQPQEEVCAGHARRRVHLSRRRAGRRALGEGHPSPATRAPKRVLRDREKCVSGKTIVKALRIIALLVLGVAFTRLVGNSVIAKIVVSKSQRSLTAYGPDGRVLNVFPVIVGRESAGTKE